MRAWDRNGNRREWPNGAAQKYAVYKILKEGSDEWAKHQLSVAEQANQARSRKAKEQHQTSNPRAGEKKSGGATTGGTTKRQPQRTSKQKATAAGVDRGTVEKVDQVTAGDRETLKEETPAKDRVATQGSQTASAQRV